MEVRKAREWARLPSISHSGGGGRGLGRGGKAMPCLGKVVMCQEMSKQPLSDAGEEGRDLTSPAISPVSACPSQPTQLRLTWSPGSSLQSGRCSLGENRQKHKLLGK